MFNKCGIYVQLLILVGFHLVSCHLQFASKQFPVSTTYADQFKADSVKKTFLSLKLAPPPPPASNFSKKLPSAKQRGERLREREGGIVDKSLVSCTFLIPLCIMFFFILPR